MAINEERENSPDMSASKHPKPGSAGPGVMNAGSSPGLEKGDINPSGYIAADRALLDEDNKPSASAGEPAGDVPTMSDDEIKTARDGFAVYEPPPISERAGQDEPVDKSRPDDRKAKEWSDIGDKLFEFYGDTLTGPARYIGPIGGVLTGVAAALIVLRLAIESSYKVINGYVMIISSGAFIIGVFLLLFHLFHRLSNRNKRVLLSQERRLRMVIGTCKFLDVRFPGRGILLKCKYFKHVLSDTPECVVCGHYDAAPETKDGGKPPIKPSAHVDGNDSGEDDNGAVVAAPLSTAKPVSKERQLLMEMDAPQIGGASGGDLDEDKGNVPNWGRA